jgi:hypothetical protein
MTTRKPLVRVGQVCQTCPKCSWRAYLRAYPSCGLVRCREESGLTRRNPRLPVVIVRVMFLGYLDDSGDPGVHAGSPTPTYTTACVLIRDAHWVGLFEDLIRFRRYLSQNFGLRMRQEVRATELVRGSGPWATLPYGDQVRKRVFRSFMRLQGKAGTVQTFAVVIDKSGCSSPDDVRITAWRHTLERIEAFARHNNDTVMLFPDSGEYHRFRKLAREMRRHSQVGAMIGGGSLARPLVRYLIDDPVERDSAQSYVVGGQPSDQQKRKCQE